MKVAIVGSRDYPNIQQVRNYVWRMGLDDELVSGGARGVDRIAEQTAKVVGMTVKSFPAEWTKYGKSAGMIRNQQIVDYADTVIAFWDGKSRGTENTIERARKAGKPVIVYYPDGRRDETK